MKRLRPEEPAETASTDAGAPALAEELAPPNDLSRLQVPAGEPEATRSTSYSSASDYGDQSNVDLFQSVRRETGSTETDDNSDCVDMGDLSSATSIDSAIRFPPQPRALVDTDATPTGKESFETRLTGLETAMTGLTTLLHTLSDGIMGRAGMHAGSAVQPPSKVSPRQTPYVAEVADPV